MYVPAEQAKPKRKRSDHERLANQVRHAKYAEANRLNPPDPDTPKRCKTCQLPKTLRDFPLNTSNKDGRDRNCLECSAKHMKHFRATNPTYGIVAHDYYERNKPAIQQKIAKHHEQYPHKRKEKGRKYVQTHREQCRANTQRRRARLKKNGFVEAINLEVLAERDHWICHICKKKVTRKTWSHDHLIPAADGGETSYRNVALAHKRCNSRRHRGKTIPAQLRLLP
jgi:hypothetical protein